MINFISFIDERETIESTHVHVPQKNDTEY